MEDAHPVTLITMNKDFIVDAQENEYWTQKNTKKIRQKILKLCRLSQYLMYNLKKNYLVFLYL